MAELQYSNDHDPDPEYVAVRNFALSKNNPVGLGPMTKTEFNDIGKELREEQNQ